MDLVGELTRRRLLQSAGYGVAVSSLALLATPADAIGATQRAVAPQEVAESRAPSRPKINISMPARVDDFDAVPISISVEKGDGEDISVDSIYVLADGAAKPELARFYPLAKGTTVKVAGDVAMGPARRLWAVAKLTDGSLCMTTADLPA